MKNLAYLLLFFVSISGYAQEKDTFDTIAKETCSCMKAKNIDFSKLNDDSSIKMTLGLCMIESYSAHKNELPVAERVEFGDKEGMRGIGEKVALKMMNHCPDYVLELGRQYLDENEDEAEAEVVEADPTVEGKVTAIEVKQFVTIKVKDKNNRVHNFMLLDYFDTASLYTENKIKVGDDLTVGYSEIELFDTTTKDFKYFKIISSLEKK